MSSKSKEDFLPITKEEFTTQITGNDVIGCLKKLSYSTISKLKKKQYCYNEKVGLCLDQKK